MLILFLIMATCIAILALYEVYSGTHYTESENWEKELAFMQDYPEFRSTDQKEDKNTGEA